MENQNIYFRCRKEAANWNNALYSRGNAADLLGVSESSLSDYELGLTKVVPVDKVVLMADLYNAPQLKSHYCKEECPIGKCLPIATEIQSIESTAVRLIKQLDSVAVEDIKKKIIDIAQDGKVNTDEIPELSMIMNSLDNLSSVISELRLLYEKTNGELKYE